MAQSPLSTVEEWQRKATEVSTHCNDVLVTAISKGFDAMSAKLTKNSDTKDVKRVLAYLNVERSIALEFDKDKDDSLRDIMYGLLESLHVSLNEWNDERSRQKKETGQISTLTEELTNLPPSFPIEPKEQSIDIHLPQDYQISASELMRDEMLVKEEEVKNEKQASSLIALQDDIYFKEEETPNDDMNSGMGDAVGNSFIEPPFNKDGSVPRTIQPSDFMEYQMEFKDEISGQRDLPLTENNSLNEVSMNSIKGVDESAPPEHSGEEDDILANDLIDNEGGEEEEAIVHPANTPKNDSDTVKVEKRRRSSRNTSKHIQYNDSMDSDGDGGPSAKNSRSDSMNMGDKKRRSFKGDDHSEVVSKKRRVVKKNDTELECPECEFRSLSVPAWVKHLRRIHSTTPALAGLALLCECGLETLTGEHSLTCAGNTSVIRKSDGPQCVQCEMHPKTANGYVHHLHRHHNSTLAQAYCCDGNIGNEIYLKCSCGLEVRSSNDYKHFNDCNPRQFTLHKLDDE